MASKNNKTTGTRKWAAIIIAVAVFSVVALSHLIGVWNHLEYKAYDLRINFFANSTRPSDDIIVILLDQESIDWANGDRGWGWPWPRKAYSEIVDFMNLAGAKAVIFDVIFSEPSVYRTARQDAIIDEAVRNLEQLRRNVEDSPPPPSGERRGSGSGLFRTITQALESLSVHADDASFIKASEDYGRVVQTVFISTQSGNTTKWP